MKLINVSWDMWRHRNGIKHGSDLTPLHTDFVARIDSLLKDQYDLGVTSLLRKHHPLLLDHSFEETKKSLTLEGKQQLLHSLELARDAFTRQREGANDRQLLEQRNLLRGWLDSTRQ